MKKLYLSILYVIMISVIVSGSILFSKPQASYNSNIHSSQYAPGYGSHTGSNNGEVFAKSQGTNFQNKQEKIDVTNNEQKLDLHAYLSENRYGQVALELAYKLDGKLIKSKIDSSQMKEIRNIFKFREKYRNGYVIKNMLLNGKMKRLYFAVEGKYENRLYRTVLYAYDLEKAHLEKLFYAVGDFGAFSITSDGKYSACSYLACPQNIRDNKKGTVIIFDCIENKQIFNSSKDLLPDYALNDLYVNSYDFLKWRDNETCELSREIRAKDGAEKEVKTSLVYSLMSRKIIE